MGDGRSPTSSDASDETRSQEQASTKLGREKIQNASSPSGHRRSLSGSLSSLSFLRSSNQSPDHASKAPPAVAEEPPTPRSSSGAMAMAVNQQSFRRRKGSLRKAALLGGGKLRAEGKERRGSNLEQVKTAEEDHTALFVTEPGFSSAPMSPTSHFDVPTPRPISSVPPPVPMVTHPVHGDPSKIAAQSSQTQQYMSLQRPRTADSTASTTDEDDSPVSPTSIALPPIPKPPSFSDSYFPPQLPRLLRRKHSTMSSQSSPLASLPPTVPSPVPSEWDYSETRWWGWVILIVTWIVFVVGMGSCFEVWSWAWDVGETPYAPPELEDDPTLPVVGYYPALIILTTVMAWVWVVVAWVGMKYFKHANISGDEV